MAAEGRLAKAAGAEPSSQMREKNARCCGAKHMSKSKCTKHFPTPDGPLLEVEIEKVHSVVARNTF